MRSIYFVLFIVLLQACTSKIAENPSSNNDIVMYNSLIMSYFGHQEMVVNSQMKIHFAAIDDHLENVKFSTNKLADFVSKSTFINGTGFFEIKAPKSKYSSRLELIASNGNQKSILNFGIKVQPLTKKSVYITIDDLPNQILDCTNIEDNRTVYLRSGFYKEMWINGKSDLTFVTEVNADVRIGQIKITNSKNIKLQGILVSPEPNYLKSKTFLIDVDSLSSHISISNCVIQSIADSKLWTQDDWDANASSGIYIKGKNCKVRNNFIQNIFHAIQTDDDFNEVSYNIVDRFAGDAIRNTGDNNKFVRNTLKNAVVADYADKDGNHDDLFQSWTFEKPIKHIEIRQNNCISILEPNLPLKSEVVQGIACFDGFEEDWIVKNNLVVIDHPHGIALFGAKNCKIRGNTIIRNPYQFNDFESDPWIMINNHKDGRESRGNDIQNNTVDTIIVKGKRAAFSTGNRIIDKDPKMYFRDYEGWDFRNF